MFSIAHATHVCTLHTNPRTSARSIPAMVIPRSKEADVKQRNDLARQITVTLSELFCVVGTLFGTGAIGTRVEESTGGAFAADATLLSPLGTAFPIIWGIIYMGLFVYTLWQWLPRNKTSVRHRAIGWLAAASMVLNAAWLLVTQVGWVWLSVVVILALAVVLGLLVRALGRHPASSTIDRIITAGTFGLYLGWVTVATTANVTAAAVSSGVDLGSVASQSLAIVVILVAIGLGVLFTILLGPRITVTVGISWGLLWIAIARLIDEPQSLPVAVAGFVAVAVLLAFWAVRLRQGRGSARAA